MKRLVLALTLCVLGCESAAPPVAKSRQVIAFCATWCGPCQRDKPKLAVFERQGVKIVHVDIDAEPALAARYKITSVPTYIVMENGRVVDRTNNVIILVGWLRWLLHQ